MEALDAETFKTMLISCETLEARNMLAQMRASDFPNLKDEARTDLHKNIFKKAYPNHKAKQLSPDQIMRFLNG